MWGAEGKNWIKIGDTSYNLDVLLRIQHATDGSLTLQHPNQNIVVTDPDLITKINHYLDHKSL